MERHVGLQKHETTSFTKWLPGSHKLTAGRNSRPALLSQSNPTLILYQRMQPHLTLLNKKKQNHQQTKTIQNMPKMLRLLSRLMQPKGVIFRFVQAVNHPGQSSDAEGGGGCRACTSPCRGKSSVDNSEWCSVAPCLLSEHPSGHPSPSLQLLP